MPDYQLPPIIVEEEFPIWPYGSETKPRYLTERGDIDAIWEKGDGTGITVAVVDTGRDKVHGASGGDLERVKVLQSPYGVDDGHGHGSWCLGAIGAASQGSGMTGLAPKCNLISFKGLRDSGGGSSDVLADGIDAAVEAGADIINMSFGGSFSSSIEAACKRAVEAKCALVASLGNSGPRGDGHPGNSVHTLGIAAVDFDLNLATFSSWSDQAEVADYGVSVYGPISGGRYARWSGTSMSGPMIAAILALIQSAELKAYGVVRTKTNADVRRILKNPALMRDLGSVGRDRKYGWGFMLLEKILDFVLKDDPNKPPPPAGENPFANGLDLDMQSPDGKHAYMGMKLVQE